MAEGGTHEENREALGGSGMPFRDLGIAGSLSHLESNGGAPNEDYRNDDGFLSTSYRWRTQNLFAFGNFDWNEFGGGPDATMREKNNVSTYGLHWQDGITDNLRADVFAGWFQDDSLVDKDTRANGDGRLTYAVNKYWSMAGGYDFSHEETRDTLVLNTAGNTFLLRRDDGGAYWENRVTIAKFYLNASVREEIYQTAVTDRTDTRLDLKLAGAYSIDKNTRLHASYGTGIRPPGGMDLAFTNNPALKPERTQGYDIGVTERFLSDRLSLDATWFRNRYKDMIVDLGGLPVTLSPYSTDNLGSALAKDLADGQLYVAGDGGAGARWRAGSDPAVFLSGATVAGAAETIGLGGGDVPLWKAGHESGGLFPGAFARCGSERRDRRAVPESWISEPGDQREFPGEREYYGVRQSAECIGRAV